MSLGLKKKGKVLKLKRILYGLCWDPCAFWKYFVEKMEACGMSQSKLNQCFFIGEQVICISYADDLLLWSKNEAHIHVLAILFYQADVDLEQEDEEQGDDAASFSWCKN